MAYFNNFPQVFYKFGDAEEPVVFEVLNTYIDLLSISQDGVKMYEKYTIQPGERPDTLSYRLYGTTEFYWTFFWINDKLRESGWPVDFQTLYDLAIKYYPNRVFVTETNISNGLFRIGATVTGSQSGTTGKIVEVNLDLGQVVVDTKDNFTVGEIISTGTGGDTETCIVLKESTQYEAVHHYNNSDGEYVDIDPHNQVTTGLIPVTFIDRLIETNTDLAEIDVLTEKTLRQVIGTFRKLVKE